MYKYYCIKIVLEDGTVGYFQIGDVFSTNINDSSFYDTVGEAMEDKRRYFDGQTLYFQGARVVRTAVVEVTSANPI